MSNKGIGLEITASADILLRTLTHLVIEESQIDALLAERGVFGGYNND